MKKAQLLCSNLDHAHRAGSISFGVSGVDRLTVFADNVLPCVLRHVGVLRLDSELAELIDAGKVLPAGDDETELRLVAVEACERIAQKSGLSARALDYYLWELGKQPEYRSKNRHHTMNTVFY